MSWRLFTETSLNGSGTDPRDPSFGTKSERHGTGDKDEGEGGANERPTFPTASNLAGIVILFSFAVLPSFRFYCSILRQRSA